MKLDLEDQVVVVTGGARGIGLAVASAFLAEGSHVAIWDLISPDESTLTSIDDTAKERSSTSPTRFWWCRTNICDDDSIAAACDSTLSRFGRIDHWVNAAAIGSGKFGFPFTKLTPDDWSKVLEVNVNGMVRVAHRLTPHFQKQRSGTFTMIGSVAGQIGSQTDPPYSASKAVAINFTQCMAKDLAPYNVRVNIVNPGMVQTALNRSVWQAWCDQQPDSEKKTYDEWAGAKIAQLTPLGRWQTPEDIANLIVFLSSHRARNITGQSINVDGGWVMRW